MRERTKDRYVGDTVLRQIAGADMLLVTKTDLIDEHTLAGLRSLLTGMARGRPVIEAVHGEVPLSVLLGVVSPESPVPRGERASGSAADDVFETWSFTSEYPLDRETLREVVASWPDGVLRVKGIVRVTSAADEPDRRVVVHRVGARTTVTDEGLWTSGPSQLVAIAIRGTIDPVELDALVATAVRIVRN